MAKKTKEEVKAEAPEQKVEAPALPPVLPQGLRRIKVTQEQLMKLQADEKLVGYNPATQEAIVE